MATTSAEFIPELWSQHLIDLMKENLVMAGRPKRDKASQMLRDAALGRPEYPEKAAYDKCFTEFKHMTATEMRMRNEEASHRLDALRYSMFNPTLVFTRERNGSE